MLSTGNSVYTWKLCFESWDEVAWFLGKINVPTVNWVDYWETPRQKKANYSISGNILKTNVYVYIFFDINIILKAFIKDWLENYVDYL